MDEAQRLLERDWRENWVYQAPELAGDPQLMPINAYRWEALCRELGI